MSKKRRKSREVGGDWLTTYSDMVTLLLTFFVLLYSFSTIDVIRFKEIAFSLQNALGGAKQTMFDYTEKTGDVPITGKKEAPKADVILPTDEEEDMYDSIVEFVDKNALGDYVTIKESSRGVIIEFKDRILFDTGKADIKQEGIPILTKISELIVGIPNSIVIEGHTDNVPIRTYEFPSNWELSSTRAFKVMYYLIGERGIVPERCSAAAYGEYSPIASNDTPEGRAENRRVNILILSDDSKQEESSE